MKLKIKIKIISSVVLNVLIVFLWGTYSFALVWIHNHPLEKTWLQQAESIEAKIRKEKKLEKKQATLAEFKNEISREALKIKLEYDKNLQNQNSREFDESFNNFMTISNIEAAYTTVFETVLNRKDKGLISRPKCEQAVHTVNAEVKISDESIPLDSHRVTSLRLLSQFCQK